ncbi:NACHT and WD domain protein [Xylariaceae sp. FL0804]|nr:NACHT and WD domain protein [Xylariaceae sp. FL0804]
MFRKLSEFRRRIAEDRSNPLPSSDPGNLDRNRSRVLEQRVESDTQSTTSFDRLSLATTTTTGNQARRKSGTDQGPLGLNVVYTPENGHKADIVFVHGLGGTSRLTWSKHKDPELFWPLTFLPLEPDICLARILTFGYNAHFFKAGNVTTSILDFAKGLLFDLKYARDEQKQDLEIGRVPLIFVVHSMGGLIVKEAYMQGQNDPEYESIIKAICAITFLATPHRGTNLATILNRILQSAIVTNSKQYVNELARQSAMLQKLNEQFRHIAPKLDIVSFYETRPTAIHIKSAKVMVLEKDSSVLGYPGEISKALDADHHGVCKYESPQDPNYITVRNVLKTLMSKIISINQSRQSPLTNRRSSRDVRVLLGLSEIPATDYIFFRDQWSQGTCQWILSNSDYLAWASAMDPTPRFLWMHGGPATGKSVLSSFIIDILVEQRASCQYFFIRFGDRTKRSLSYLLRSIAFQIAESSPVLLQRVAELADEAIDLANASPTTIWERAFKSILSDMKDSQPMYWIIDGLDEAEDPRQIVRMLSDLSTWTVPIRLLLVSRKTSDIASALQKVNQSLQLTDINIEGHEDDLHQYLRQELTMPGTTEFHEDVARRVLQRAQNNFLWVRLAVTRLNSCHRFADVEVALHELPIGMEALYDRMVSSIQKRHSDDKALTLKILNCVTSAFGTLSLAEVAQAIAQDTPEILDFQTAVVDLCAGLTVIDNGGNVSMIHQTAREYLVDAKQREFYVDRAAAHLQMFLSCMQCLMTVGLRAKISRNAKPEFLDYAANYWHSHLISTAAGCTEVRKVLKKFLTGPWVLIWIQILATEKKLRVLIQASRDLSKYATQQCRHHMETGEDSDLFIDRALIENWAVDLLNLVGKFGAALTRNPEAMFKNIPPFCPRNSSIYQQFGKPEERSISVSGISSEGWEHSPLARISLPDGARASSIAAAGGQVAMLEPSGSIFIHDSSTFEERIVSPIIHGERVSRIKMNGTATLLATYGYRTTKVWEVSAGKCLLSVPNVDSWLSPLAMSFTLDNTTLLIGTDDRRIRSLSISEAPGPAWTAVAELEEPELEGHFLNSASHMALNRDSSLVSVAYRGHPLSAFEIDGAMHLGHCWRKRKEISRGEVIEAIWHPHAPELMGMYIEGVVFKWNPYDGTVDEVSTGGSRLALSTDGNLLATGDGNGLIQIFTTSGLSLLYKSASQDTVLGLAFSPNSRRLYDIRGHYGNAWEPNSLADFSERAARGNASEHESTSPVPSSCAIAISAHRVDTLTACATSPLGRLYCYGTVKGSVRLYDTQGGQIADIHASRGFLSIGQLGWSKDGLCICYTDVSKKLFIRSVTPPFNETAPIIGDRIEVPLRKLVTGPITQLIFHPDSSRILVVTPSMLSVVTTKTGIIAFSQEKTISGVTWIEHPTQHDQLIGIGLDVVHAVDWELKRFSTARLQLGDYIEPSVPKKAVLEKVLPAEDKRYLMIQISAKNKGLRENMFFFIDTAEFPRTTTPTTDTSVLDDTLSAIPLTGVPTNVSLALGFLPGHRLVYMSDAYSICTKKVSVELDPLLAGSSALPANLRKEANKNVSAGSDLKELFSLPGDWISKDSLALSSIWAKERAFVCPRNGEVAVVKCSALG